MLVVTMLQLWLCHNNWQSRFHTPPHRLTHPNLSHLTTQSRTTSVVTLYAGKGIFGEIQWKLRVFWYTPFSMSFGQLSSGCTHSNTLQSTLPSYALVFKVVFQVFWYVLQWVSCAHVVLMQIVVQWLATNGKNVPLSTVMNDISVLCRKMYFWNKKWLRCSWLTVYRHCHAHAALTHYIMLHVCYVDGLALLFDVNFAVWQNYYLWGLLRWCPKP